MLVVEGGKVARLQQSEKRVRSRSVQAWIMSVKWETETGRTRKGRAGEKTPAS